MVKSHLNSKVFYNESRELDDVDIDYSAPVYEYNLYGVKTDIVLGKQNHSFSKYDIVYFPIYLINNDEIVSKIGYFEIESDKLLNVVDDEGDVQINKKGMIFFINKDELLESGINLINCKNKPSLSYPQIEEEVKENVFGKNT